MQYVDYDHDLEELGLIVDRFEVNGVTYKYLKRKDDGKPVLGLKPNEETGKFELEHKFRFIDEHCKTLRRRGFVIPMQWASGYYGLIILQPKKAGFWMKYNKDCCPDSTTSWKVIFWTEELCKKLGVTFCKLSFKEGCGGWWHAQGDARLFDCLGNVQNDKNQFAKYPERYGATDEDDSQDDEDD